MPNQSNPKRSPSSENKHEFNYYEYVADAIKTEMHVHMDVIMEKIDNKFEEMDNKIADRKDVKLNRNLVLGAYLLMGIYVVVLFGSFVIV